MVLDHDPAGGDIDDLTPGPLGRQVGESAGVADDLVERQSPVAGRGSPSRGPACRRYPTPEIEAKTCAIGASPTSAKMGGVVSWSAEVIAGLRPLAPSSWKKNSRAKHRRTRSRPANLFTIHRPRSARQCRLGRISHFLTAGEAASCRTVTSRDGSRVRRRAGRYAFSIFGDRV